ncbi:MAG: Aminodeoxychorismate synthase component 1 [Bacteroidota bacterium]|jgi:para-aminobenzoate synthetase component 1
MEISFLQRVQTFKQLSELHERVVLLESNGYEDPYGQYEWIILAGNQNAISDSARWEELSAFLDQNLNCPVLPAYLSYDLKNDLEKVFSENPDATNFPELSCWEPSSLIAKKRDGQLIHWGQSIDVALEVASKSSDFPIISMLPSYSEAQYTQEFDRLKQHILRGDIYEVNFCIHFGTVVKELDPVQLFLRLNALSPAPFACLLKDRENWLIGSSPERFLVKKGERLISQPIKGTIRKGQTEEQNHLLDEKLRNDPKERSENVMIVDLVRNDLSHFAKRGSVQVKELCGIYPFATVMHMISTIEARVTESRLGLEALKKAFPMGSMTGAPKIRAMQLAERAENFKRGIYSGAIGYFTPEGDFDFSVVIRSFTWNSKSGYLSFSTGSAITQKANAQDEYRECLLKAEALLNSLSQ